MTIENSGDIWPKLPRYIQRAIGMALAITFAGTGYALWRPVWQAVFLPLRGGTTPVAQILSGVADAMLLFGPMAGMVIGVWLLSIYQSCKRDHA